MFISPSSSPLYVIFIIIFSLVSRYALLLSRVPLWVMHLWPITRARHPPLQVSSYTLISVVGPLQLFSTAALNKKTLRNPFLLFHLAIHSLPSYYQFCTISASSTLSSYVQYDSLLTVFYIVFQLTVRSSPPPPTITIITLILSAHPLGFPSSCLHPHASTLPWKLFPK